MMEAKGVPTIRDDGMGDVMKHNYLRKSIEQRVENKQLIRDYKLKQHKALKNAIEKTTKSQLMRDAHVGQGIE